MAPARSKAHQDVHIVNSDHNGFSFTWDRASSIEDAVLEKSNDEKSIALSLQHAPAPDSYMKQVQFKSLRDILDEFNRRRSLISGETNQIELKRKDSGAEEEYKNLHSSIQKLEKRLIGLYNQGENQRTEEKLRLVKELEAELASLRAKISFHEKFDDAHIRFTTIRRSSIRSAPDLESDKGSDEDVEFVDPADLDLTEEELIPSVARLSVASFTPVESSTLFVPDPCQEHQTQQFENAIAELSEQLAHTKSALGVIKIELINLGFSERPNESCKTVLAAIRHAFRQARIEFQDIFPEQHVEHMQNSAFLRLVLDNIRGVLARMEEQVLRIQHQEQAIALYRAEYNGVLNKLSESDRLRVRLEEAQKQMKITLSQKEQQLVSIEKEIHKFSKRVDKKQLSEISLSKELSWLQEILNQLEQKYVVVIQSLRTEKEEAVTSLRTKIEKERTEKESIVKEMSLKQKTIIDLQKSLSESKESIQSVRMKYESESRKYQSFETRLEKKTQHIVKLEEKLKLESKNVIEIQKKLDIAKDALIVQKQQYKEEIDSEIERRRRIEVQVTEVTNELQKTKSVQKRHEEKVSSLTTQLKTSKVHSQSLQAKISELHETLTKRSTLIKSLESKVSSREDSHVRQDQQIQSLKEQLKSVTELKISLEKRINEKNKELTQVQSSSSEKTSMLEVKSRKLETTIEEQASQLIQIEEQYEEERKTSAMLREQIEHIRANARKMSRSLKEAHSFMEQTQLEVIKKVVEEMSGKQKVTKERLSEVKDEYESVLTDIEALKLDTRIETVRTKRKTDIRKQVKDSKQISQMDYLSRSFAASTNSRI
jgi:DNA repair exonuclease SbcCD ATPase subunit